MSFTKEEFLKIIDFYKFDKSYNYDFLYKVFSMSSEAIENILNDVINTKKNVDEIALIHFLIGEYSYYLSDINEEKKESLTNDEKSINEMASFVADKYLASDIFGRDRIRYTSRFEPPVSTLNVFINVMENLLDVIHSKQQGLDLIPDLLTKSVSLIKGILDLILKGFDTEAVAIWRTLHECESTLIVLSKYGKSTVDAYLKHMQYGLAFKGGTFNKEETDKIFNVIKEEMREHDLKSKDMKKYIEYGWMYSTPDFKEEEGYKLNFRDGLEKLANLDSYNKIYETSSEIIHATPSLIYSNKIFYHYLCLLSTYDSFFRIENIFNTGINNLLDEVQIKTYSIMRNSYLSQLRSIYAKESQDFNNFQLQSNQRSKNRQ